MNKEQMVSLLSEITELEKLLMRNLNENEIEYLKDHTKEEFLFDVLQLDESNISNLNKLRTYIANLTSPVKSYNNCTTDVNIYSNQTDYENLEENETFFDTINNSRNILSDIVRIIEDAEAKRELEEYNNRQIINVTTADKSNFNLEDSIGNDSEVWPDDAFDETSPIDIVNALPEATKKWTENLTINEMLKAVDNAVTILSKDYIERHQEELMKPESFLSSIQTIEDELDEDTLAGEIVDQIKDIAIAKYIKQLEEHSYLTFEDEEIQSEVLDYLYKNDYKVKSINNKVYLI